MTTDGNDGRLRDVAGRKIFFFDRDGTVCLGKRIIDGAARLLELLKARGIPYYVCTNNSSRTAAEHWERLASLPLTAEDIAVSTDATIAHLRAVGIDRIHLLATESVTRHFRDEGFTLTDEDPGAAVLTYDNEITYAKIRRFVEVLRTDVPYFATHIDLLYPYEGGFLPDIGTYATMFASATGRRPEASFGKPNFALVDHLLARHGLTAADAVVVGDRLYTDIALAEGTEMLSVLVLSGETMRGDLEAADHRPDVVIDSVADLCPLFENDRTVA
jgi:HAD superfamily hydrolase (TIGR01450 family)